MIKLTYNIQVQPHQSVRQGKSRSGKKVFFQPSKIKNYKETIITLTKEQLPDGFKIYTKETPLLMSVYYVFEYKKSEPKKNRGKLIPKVTKPDVTDNTQKALVDALSGVVFEQDQQIFYIEATKFWGPQDLISIYIHDKCKILEDVC